MILLNDGSADDSLHITERLMRSDNRIRLVNDGENKGLVSRLNQVIDLAKGDYKQGWTQMI